MTNLQSKRRKHLEGQKLAPDWSVFYQLGRETSKKLPARMTYVEIASRLGVKRSTVQAFTFVALGKLVYRARQSVNFEKA